MTRIRITPTSRRLFGGIRRRVMLAVAVAAGRRPALARAATAAVMAAFLNPVALAQDRIISPTDASAQFNRVRTQAREHFERKQRAALEAGQPATPSSATPRPLPGVGPGGRAPWYYQGARPWAGSGPPGGPGGATPEPTELQPLYSEFENRYPSFRSAERPSIIKIPSEQERLRFQQQTNINVLGRSAEPGIGISTSQGIESYAQRQAGVANLNPYRSNFQGVGAYAGRFGNQGFDFRTRAQARAGRETNLNFGDFQGSIGAIAGFDFTDNALLTQINPLSDIIATAALTLRGTYPLTKQNIFSFDLGIGIQRYLINTEINSLLSDGGLNVNIAPNSNFSFDFSVGSVFFTLFDTITVRQTVLDDALVPSDQNFSQIQNTLGISALWQASSALSITGGISRFDSSAIGNVGTSQDVTSNRFSGSIAYSPSQTWVGGIEFTFSANERTGGILNNSDTYSFGAFYTIPITRFTQIRVSGGLQDGKFEDTGTIDDGSQLDEFYGSLLLTNVFNSFTSQTLSVGREADLGTVSNFVTVDFLRYNLVLEFTKTTIVAGLYLEQEKDSNFDSVADDVNSFATPQNVDRYGINLQIAHQLNRDLKVYLGYNFGVNNSEIPPGTVAPPTRSLADITRINTRGQDFTQHRFSFDISYPLTKDVDLILGYQFTKAVSSEESGSFQENRGNINFSYNF